MTNDNTSLTHKINVELEVTSQQSVLPNNRTTDGRTKDAKVLTKDAKLGREDWKKSHDSSLTRPTNALTVQAITELGIVQQNINHMRPPIATQLMVQVFTKIAHNLEIILPSSTHNKVPQ